ncbi:hypothetical protein PMAYCL1PPCAC_24919 [Pristionchus mayeri]|uniref:Uncharacterized protein n=1 Tax=Pristionchus mayeri TaxID=1317129 RepID=A0AAN5D1N6_9BILA|nr:hypothetical protein PMAYCL1PPCAC_24919 [Pristionchus mayeri]
MARVKFPLDMVKRKNCLREPRSAEHLDAPVLEYMGGEENPMGFAENPASMSLNFKNIELSKENPEEAREDSIASDALPPSIAQLLQPPILSGTTRMCYLCGKMVDHFYATPTQPEERAAFLARVNISKKYYSTSIRALRRNQATAYFCVEHLGEIKQENPDSSGEAGFELPAKVNKSKRRVKKCCLCGTRAKVIYSTPADPIERAAFLAQVIALTETERRIVEVLSQLPEERHFCAVHFHIPSNSINEMDGSSQEPLELPQLEAMNVAPAETVKIEEPDSPGEAVNEFDANGLKGVNCTLCAKYTHNYVATSSIQALREDLLGKVITSTKEEKNLIARLMHSTTRAAFCAEHIQDVKVNEEPQNLSTLRPRECYLCGDTTVHWLATPINPIGLPNFFENLILMDENKLYKIQRLINWNASASICTKHYNGPTMEVLELTRVPGTEPKERSPPAQKKKRVRYEPSEPDSETSEDEKPGPSRSG